MISYEQHIIHPFSPVYNRESKLLILGSFPSVKSREDNFYYGHPRNRFWKVLSCILDEPIPLTIIEKTDMLLNHGIALWDVIYSCDIVGSSDSSIKNVVPNNLSLVIDNSNVSNVICNGSTAFNLYNKYLFELTNIDSIILPSTSPANASYSFEKLRAKWEIIRSMV